MRDFFRFLSLASLIGAGLLNGQLATKKALTLDVAKKIVEAASVEAKKNSWTVVICIVDDGGNLIYLEKADGTQIGSIEVAQEKAKAAVRFKRPTKVQEDALVGGRQAVLKLPGFMPVEGGIPLMVGTELVGAIGVSGVTSQQDGQIAAAGVAAMAAIK